MAEGCLALEHRADVRALPLVGRDDAHLRRGRDPGVEPKKNRVPLFGLKGA